MEKKKIFLKSHEHKVYKKGMGKCLFFFFFSFLKLPDEGGTEKKKWGGGCVCDGEELALRLGAKGVASWPKAIFAR